MYIYIISRESCGVFFGFIYVLLVFHPTATALWNGLWDGACNNNKSTELWRASVCVQLAQE